MGVGGILPKVLPSAGHKVDLTTFRDGVRMDDTRRRRPLRVAIDVSGWIAKASHGYGSMLMNEQHLTNFGRAKLMQQENDNNNGMQNDATTANSDSTAAANGTAEREFVTQCALFVLNKVLHLKTTCRTDIMVVLDGASPPVKATVCRARRQRRQEAAQARDAVSTEPNDRFRAARRAGADHPVLHSEIVQDLMGALRQERIPFLVAPYEADGQLVYLSQCGYTDLIVTDDSDLIAHGANHILYKLEEQGCCGILLQRHDLGCASLNAETSLVDFSNAMLATMFVAAGCDYCESLRGIGIVTSRNIVKRAFHGQECNHKKRKHDDSSQEKRVPPLKQVLDELYQSTYDKTKLTLQAKQEYESNFLAAIVMYRHPIVFDPLLGQCTFAGDPPNGSDDQLVEYEPYARLVADTQAMEQVVGKLVTDSDMATLIAEGWVNPRTKRLFQQDNLDHVPAYVREMWQRLEQSKTGSVNEDANDNDDIGDGNELRTTVENMFTVSETQLTTDSATQDVHQEEQLETQDVTTTQQEEAQTEQQEEAQTEEMIRDDAVMQDVEEEEEQSETLDEAKQQQQTLAEETIPHDTTTHASPTMVAQNTEQHAAQDDTYGQQSGTVQDETLDDKSTSSEEIYEAPRDVTVEPHGHDPTLQNDRIDEGEEVEQADTIHDESPSQHSDQGDEGENARVENETMFTDLHSPESQATVDFKMSDSLPHASDQDESGVSEEEPQQQTQASNAEVIDLMDSDDDDDDDAAYLATQPQYSAAVPSQIASHSYDLTLNSPGNSSSSKFGSQPSSHPSDGSHISADVRSPNLLHSVP